jgi:hypothetical protein
MPFPIDMSQAFRYPSQLTRLARAVRAAGEQDETRWIEWKRSLDLTTEHAVWHIAKQILGFANRDPSTAVQWAEGYAYLLVGISPGRLDGVAQIDHERLISKIRPYVGGEIVWTPEYVRLDNVDVLVIIVEPPHPGDGIHVVRKSFSGYQPGTVLIRRSGQTAQADVDEMAMLQRRLLAGTPQVQLGVEPVSHAIETWPEFSGIAQAWTDRVRPRLLAARHSASNRRDSVGGVIMPVLPDRRTLEEYNKEVEDYLRKAHKAIVRQVVWRLGKHNPAMLRLRVVNPTERNFSQVRVSVTIDVAAVRTFNQKSLDLLNKAQPKVPEPPSAFGTPRSILPDSLGKQFIAVPNTIGDTALRRSWYADSLGDKVQIVFQPCDLRPNDSPSLAAVPLIVMAETGASIKIEWTATATNANGQATGSMELAVTASTLDVNIAT